MWGLWLVEWGDFGVYIGLIICFGFKFVGFFWCWVFWFDILYGFIILCDVRLVVGGLSVIKCNKVSFGLCDEMSFC